MRFSKLSLSILCLLPSVSMAEIDWNGNVRLERTFSDNVALEEENERTESSNLLSSRIALEARERTYQATGSYVYSWEEWQHDSFDANSYLEGSLRADAFLIPGRLTWFVRHAQSLSKTISTLPDTPDNREELSIISTGPTLTQRINDRSSVTIDSAISKIDLEESAVNNLQRLSNALSYSYILSPITSLSGRLSGEKSEYDGNEAANYSRESVSLSIRGTRPLFSYSVSVGANTVRPDEGSDDTGKSIDVSVSRSSQKLRYELSVGKEITDTVFGSEDVFSGSIDGTVDPETNVGDVQIIDREEVRFVSSYALVPNQLDLGLSMSYQNDESKTSNTIDDTTRTLLLDGRYVIKTGLSTFVEFELTISDFDGLSAERTDKLYRGAAGFDYILGTSSVVAVQIEYQDLNSNQISSSYDEFSASLSYTYNFGR